MSADAEFADDDDLAGAEDAEGAGTAPSAEPPRPSSSGSGRWTPDDRAQLFGTVAVDMGAISAQQLRDGLEQQLADSKAGQRRQLGETLIFMAILTPQDVQEVLNEQRRRREDRLADAPGADDASRTSGRNTPGQKSAGCLGLLLLFAALLAFVL